MLKEIHLKLDADGKVQVFGLSHSPWESAEQAAALERLIALLEHVGHGPGHRVPEPGAPSLPGAWSEWVYCYPPSRPLASAADQGPAFLHRCGYAFTEQGGYPTTREGITLQEANVRHLAFSSQSVGSFKHGQRHINPHDLVSVGCQSEGREPCSRGHIHDPFLPAQCSDFDHPIQVWSLGMNGAARIRLSGRAKTLLNEKQMYALLGLMRDVRLVGLWHRCFSL